MCDVWRLGSTSRDPMFLIIIFFVFCFWFWVPWSMLLLSKPILVNISQGLKVWA